MSHQSVFLSGLFSVITLLGFACGGAAEKAAAPSDQAQVFTLSYQNAPADNPLKGFVPYQGAYTFPHSLEWFYLPLKDLQTDFSTFNWAPLDACLNAIAGRGHQAVFRIYLDYPNHP